jgi:hypothetical protein
MQVSVTTARSKNVRAVLTLLLLESKTLNYNITETNACLTINGQWHAVECRLLTSSLSNSSVVGILKRCNEDNKHVHGCKTVPT